MNDSITITKDDLKDLITKEVVKALTTKAKVYPPLLFDNVRFSREDLTSRNAKYRETSRTNINNYGGNTYSRHQYETKDFANRTTTKDMGPYSDAVNVEIRHLALAVLGETRIKDVSSQDYSRAINIYSQFKDLFLKLYDQRLNDLFGGENNERN
ncbi:hypothetical protein [Companilactobacillus musae]|uniref:hypothetical protein n=1 Tax=Companilactobacillus musae TaxID=1903258 RepID=UPI003439DB8C